MFFTNTIVEVKLSPGVSPNSYTEYIMFEFEKSFHADGKLGSVAEKTCP